MLNLVMLTEPGSLWRALFEHLAELLGASGSRVRDSELVAGTLPTAVQPVLRYLPRALDLADAQTREVCALLMTLRGALHWRQNASYIDTEFLDRYAYCELLGPSGHWRHADLALGLLLLGPGVTYPEHIHPAAETYVVLSGDAEWRQGQGQWRQRRPGSVITHVSMEPHAMRTTLEPLLAAYLWQDHLHEPARLVSCADF
jgi:hypothetical protein